MKPDSLIRPDALNELMETARATPPGDFVEVGVYKGGSAAVLADVAREQGRRLFLFDTFSGIPTADPSVDWHVVGDFGDTSADAVRKAIPDAFVVEGVFPGTLTNDVGPIAFAHIDVDQYESTSDACLALRGRMVAGGIMVFDDFDVLPSAERAVREIFGNRVTISKQGKARVYF